MKVCINNERAGIIFLRRGYRAYWIRYSNGLQCLPNGKYKNLWCRPHFEKCIIERKGVQMKLKNLVDLPNKHIVEATTLHNHLNGSCKGCMNYGANERQDKIGNIEVELDVGKMSEIMVRDIAKQMKPSITFDEGTYELLGLVAPKGVKRLAQTLADNFKELLK